uniref:RING-type domain-containing protein n=1 Tax=Amphimedon queenslandica TaxID=400682 RepID=A0A1X7UX65_AMPQE
MATRQSSPFPPDLMFKLEDQLTCPVCLDHYFNPKTLPCLHSFCQQCIEVLPLDKKNETYYLSCPICRHHTELPKEGVGAFPVAFHLNNLKEIIMQAPDRTDGSHRFPHSLVAECMYNSDQRIVSALRQEMPTVAANKQGALTMWMEEGSVDLTITRVNMLGAPGSGKTCAQLLLLDEDPPTEDDADSTSISYPIRVAVDDESMKWDQITRDKLLGGLAADLIKASKKQSVAEVLSVDTHQLSPSKVSVSSKSRKDEVDYHVEEVVQEILATKPVGIQLKGHWLYIIDLCGQPAYQELLPLFTRAASLNIITLDLSRPFDEKFEMKYKIDGRYFPCCSKSTQLASFQSSVSTSANFNSLDIPSVTKEHGHSMHLVLGTHYDKVDETTLHECEDSLKTSMSSLQPYLRDRIICNSTKSQESIIFPVNTMAESEERAKYGEEIRQAIWLYGSGASLTIKIPIRWFAFELSFPEKKRIISIKEALSIGERYGMKEEETMQTLLYFHDVSLMLYYPEVTDVVFVDPKPILNILSHLLALTYVNDGSALKSILLEPLDQIVINHLKDGFFNEEIFTHLKCKSEIFCQPEFQLIDLISLLLHLYIITKVEDNTKGNYFIPYALSSYQGSAIPTVEVSNVQPLLIVWIDYESCESPPPPVPVPQGLFPLAIMHLLNQKEFEIKLPSSRSNHHYFRFRDAMSIKITFNEIPYTLHLINRYTHIEVSFNGPQKHCPNIRKLVMKAIGKVSDNLHMEHNYINAFACIKDQEKKCYCIVVNEEQFIVNCTECPKPYPMTEDKCKCWFECVTAEINDPLITTFNHRLTIKDLNEVLNDLKSGGFSDESYFGLGLELGLHHGTLNNIKSNNTKCEDQLRECISKWLMRSDDVDKRGGANWTMLCNAVEKMNRAAADYIRARHNILTSQPIEQSSPQNHVEPDTQTTGSDEGARRRYPLSFCKFYNYN